MTNQDLEYCNWSFDKYFAYDGKTIMAGYKHNGQDHLARFRLVLDDERFMDTHRTVTLRIPKGMRIGEAIYEVWTDIIGDSYGIMEISDTDLQKALDEVEHE